MIDLWHLEKIDWLSQLSAESTGLLKQDAVIRSFAKGEQVFGPHSSPEELFVLETGLIRIFRESADAQEVTFGFIRPGEIFGESVLFGGQSRESQAVAVEPSDVLVCSREVFLQAMTATPIMGFAIAKQIEGRFRNIETRVEDLVFRSARNRLAHILLQLADQFGRNEDGATVLPMQLTHKDLATLIGTSRPTVSLAINDLEKAELIGREGRLIRIANTDDLARAIDRL